jgi:hypothetical protein
MLPHRTFVQDRALDAIRTRCFIFPFQYVPKETCEKILVTVPLVVSGWGSAHETDSIPLTEYCPIFRVPEYSELSVAI